MIREEIIKAFEQSGLSQKELSAMTGITQSSISQYFNNKRELVDAGKEKIMQALNLRIVQVLPGETLYTSRVKE